MLLAAQFAPLKVSKHSHWPSAHCLLGEPVHSAVRLMQHTPAWPDPEQLDLVW